ncbi:MAG: AAA family ATPase [Verrucomicrobiales bacterium]
MMEQAMESARRLEQSVGRVMRGQEETVRRVLAAMASGGHVLLEDYPGTGKTTMAKAIAASIGTERFSRIQFTPDLLPSDILGVSVFDPQRQEFEFHPGPIFADIVLADEINRASPRTQSALLEAMGENQATIEGKRHELNGLFFVIATQNPVEFRGTYPLPEAQMDRFALRRSLGYVSVEHEMEILEAQRHRHPLEEVGQVTSIEDVLALKEAVKEVRFSAELQHYVVRLVAETRQLKEVKLPASPRASLSLMRISQALSLFEGREFVTPECVQSLAADVIGHRLVVDPEARYAGRCGRTLVGEILESVEVPV